MAGTREVQFSPRSGAGFPAGSEAHHLVSRSDHDVLSLAVGGHSPGNGAPRRNDNLAAAMTETGGWRYTRKDGTAIWRGPPGGSAVQAGLVPAAPGERRPPRPRATAPRPPG